jgi:DNA-binding FadR family transcriptional regulator
MHKASFSAVNRTRLADQAYTALLTKIVTGEFAEGQSLPTENELGALFGISRPVVREALRRLREEGLIASRRGSGSFVQPRPAPDLARDTAAQQKRMLDNLEFRFAIEPQAAALAAERRTDADLGAIQEIVDRFARVALQGGIGLHLDYGFHLGIATAAHNPRFVEAIQTVQHDIDHGVDLARYLSRFEHLERSRSILDDHSRILEGIRQSRAEEARRMMRAHLENARLRMQQSQPPLIVAA